MRHVHVDTDRKLLYVQGGCNWGDVDTAAAKHGLATVGGTVTDTGVGGLTLGGGYGFLSGQRGLVIDNLVECTTVLANGDTVKSSKTSHPDLFWALRGAGQNFGVTTEFVLQAYDQGDVWAGMLMFPPLTPDVVDIVVNATNDLFQADENGLTKVAGRAGGGIAIMKPPPAQGATMLVVAIFFFGTESEGRSLFKPYFDIGPVVDTMAMVPYSTINTLLAPPIGNRASMKGAAFTLPLRGAFVNEILAEYESFTAGNPDTPISMLMWELYDPKKVTESQEGCFANRGWYLNGLICPIWTEETNDRHCRQWARDMSLRFKEELERQGHEASKGVDGGVGIRGKKGATLLYGNYDRKSFFSSSLALYLCVRLCFFGGVEMGLTDHAEYDEKSRDIFGDHYPELQQLKAKYDPTNMFDKLFAITPQS
jgi:hypothetical protein